MSKIILTSIGISLSAAASIISLSYIPSAFFGAQKAMDRQVLSNKSQSDILNSSLAQFK